MDVDFVAKVNLAVDEALDRCRSSSTPAHLTLTGFCDELHTRGDWSDSEVELVRSIASRVLTRE